MRRAGYPDGRGAQASAAPDTHGSIRRMAPAREVARVEVGSFRRDGVEILREVRWTIRAGEHSAHRAARGPCGALSEGNGRRVRIAGAFSPPPALLVLDGPCEGLDRLARGRLLEDLARFASRPGAPTMVLVTHHLEEIPPFVSHGLLLGNGAVVAMGRVEEVVTDAHLSRAFGTPSEVTRDAARRYSLRFRSR